MANFSNEYLNKTNTVWQKYSPDPLTLEDAREIAETVIGLYAEFLGLEEKDEKKTDI